MKKKTSMAIIFATVFIDLMGFGILIPILPTFASKNLGASDFEIGIVVASFSFIQFLFNPVMGKISDRVGRRPIILISLFVTAVSYLIFSFTTTFSILLFSRMLAGLGGSNIGVAQAYIADITSKEDRAKGMGMIGAAFGLGFLFGPLIGGLLANFSYAVAGFGAAGFSFIAFIFALLMLPESVKDKSSVKIVEFKLFDFKFIKTTMQHPAIGILILLFFIIIFSMANIYGTFSLLGYKVYNFSDQQNGYLFGVIGIVSTIMQGGVIRILSQKFEDRWLILFGSFFMMFGLGFLPYGGNFLGVAVVVTVLSIGTGILQPIILSMISKFAPEKDQGSIMGLNHSFSAFARVLGPLWGGFAFEMIGYQYPFLTGAVFTFITFLIGIFLLNSSKLQQK